MRKNSFPVCVALDFETAGYYDYSACAIGMARIQNMEVVDEFYSLIRPPSPEILFSHIHGLYWKDLKNAEPFAEVWEKANEFIADAAFLIAHNATFDRRILYACCDAFFTDKPEQSFLCTLKGARRALQLETYGLDTVSGYFGFELNHHNASSDAFNCAKIFTRLLKMGITENDMLCKTYVKKYKKA